ncbi:MAG: GNAT family N-acetyltransferase [Cyclobacteriaceae bacterium]
MVETAFEILDYKPAHQTSFETLNRQWIEKYFSMEPLDYAILQNPEEYIIKKGGSIFMAAYNGEMAGTVALKFISPGVYELTKMAVNEKFQGKKIGRGLAEAAIARAKNSGGKKVILYSNTMLQSAMALYYKLGFREIPVDGPYKRTNIKMELTLA